MLSVQAVCDIMAEKPLRRSGMYDTVLFDLDGTLTDPGIGIRYLRHISNTAQLIHCP